jgi:8-oxo-dGTP diphosphatase
VLLCRFDLPEHGVVVWTPPGGGVERGESAAEALRREMAEEVGLVVAHPLPHVWHQRVVAEGHAKGYDGVINDYYLLKTAAFEPRGTLGDEALRHENIAGLRWWDLEEMRTYRGQAIFAPRALPQLVTDLLGLDDLPSRLLDLPRQRVVQTANRHRDGGRAGDADRKLCWRRG